MKDCRRTGQVAAAVVPGRLTVRARSLVCVGGCTRHYQRNSRLASGCAGSDRILQPAAAVCYYVEAHNGKVGRTWRSCSDVW
jgi:hypothetical protein